MTIVTACFAKENSFDFDNMLKVWEYTAKKYHKGAKVVILKIPPPPTRPEDEDIMPYNAVYSFMEVGKWVLQQSDKCIITDADIMFTGNCSKVFKADFNIACTVRDAHCWINSGVLFYKPTKAGKKVLSDVLALTKVITEKPELYTDLIKKYIGADQAAIAVLKRHFMFLPCAIYNSEQHSWDKFSDKTKIVHLKSSLGQLIRGEPMGSEYEEGHNIYKLYNMFKQYLKVIEVVKK